MPERSAIYLDSNAGAPLHPKVREALCAFLSEGFPALANPSSTHAHGRRTKAVVLEAREAVLKALGGSSTDTLVFTSSGSEANQMAIRAALEPALVRGEKVHWVTTPIEHNCNLQMVDWVKARGGEVSFLPLDPQGRVRLDTLDSVLRPHTRLVSVIWANNETGVLQPVEALTAVLKQRGIALHWDAVSAFGKVPLKVSELKPAYLTVSSHKIGGLPGVGALWCPPKSAMCGPILGKQQQGARGGTEGVLGIYSFGVACKHLPDAAELNHLADLRDRLETLIVKSIPGVQVNGAGAERVCDTLNLSFTGVPLGGLVSALDVAGYCVSSGSACSSGIPQPSHVLLAMGRSPEEALAAVRISIPHGTMWPDLEAFVSALKDVVGRLRAIQAQAKSTPKAHA